MNLNTIKLPQLSWHGVKDLEIGLPDSWNIETCNMNGYNRKALTPDEIRSAIHNPIGTEPIRKLAKGKKQVVIIFDDIQRATRIAPIVPFVLDELAEAGIRDDQIRFIGATGLHAAMDRFDFVKKLGEDVLCRFPVYNHNAFGSCTDIGTTSLGTRLQVNAEVMACDLKIAIGSVVPHAFAGFGGGAKIVLPGICHYDTVVDFHTLASKFQKEHPDKPIGVGIVENNLLRMNMEEAAEKVGLDIKIDTMINSYGETVAVYAGSLKKAYPEALEDARRHYDTQPLKGCDVVIANSFAKVAECESGLEIAFPAVRPEGGDVVLIGNAPEGHVAHYLAGPWGKTNRSKLQMQCGLPPQVKRLIIYNEYPDRTIFGYFAQPEIVVLLSKWNDVLDLLTKRHPGQAKVGVYPNADIQYCSAAKGSSILKFEINH
jgi:nickel-dependent lactate racemase